MSAGSVGASVLLLVEVDVRLVDDPVAAGSRIFASEVPVAAVVRYRRMQCLDGLENDFHLAAPVQTSGPHALHDLAGDLLGSERLEEISSGVKGS